MHNRDDIERSYSFGELAFSQIKGRSLAAVPRNYEIWYCYASGYHAELSDAVNLVLSEKGSIYAGPARHDLRELPVPEPDGREDRRRRQPRHGRDRVTS
jgi:hypothetical protein